MKGVPTAGSSLAGRSNTRDLKERGRVQLPPEEDSPKRTQSRTDTMGPSMSSRSYRSSRNANDGMVWHWQKHEDMVPGCLHDYIAVDRQVRAITTRKSTASVRVTQHDLFHQPLLVDARANNRASVTGESLVENIKRGLPVLVYAEDDKFEPRILKVDEDLTLLFIVHLGDQVEGRPTDGRSEKSIREPGVVDLHHMTELLTGDTAVRVFDQCGIRDPRLTEETAFVINSSKHSLRSELIQSERHHHDRHREERVDDDEGGAGATLLGAKSHGKLLFVIASVNLQLQRTLKEVIAQATKVHGKRNAMEFLSDARSETLMLGISVAEDEQVVRSSGDIDIVMRLCSQTREWEEDQEEMHVIAKLCSNAPKAGVKKVRGETNLNEDVIIEVPLQQKVPALKDVSQLIVNLVDKGLSCSDACRVELVVCEAAAFRSWATTMLPELFPPTGPPLLKFFRTPMDTPLKSGQALPEHLKSETSSRGSEHLNMLRKRAKDTDESMYYEAALRATALALSHFIALEQRGESLVARYETEFKQRAKARPDRRAPTRHKTLQAVTPKQDATPNGDGRTLMTR
mmetsp:Transcript_66220/g.158394  ORF Transcript_66220/g.158394 Transcript_66220/m.158394 type:complete len:572 (-) Transcript_66220:9-1724(-)